MMQTYSHGEMREPDDLGYDPHRLLNTLIEQLHLKNDSELARALEVSPPVISKIRHFRMPVGASLLIRMHEVSGLSVGDLRYLMGDRRSKFRTSGLQGKPKNKQGNSNPNSDGWAPPAKVFQSDQDMDDVTFDILRTAVRVAHDEQIRHLPDLRTRLAQLYPHAEPQREAAIVAWSKYLQSAHPRGLERS